jgi:hypothetical protein
LIGVGRGRKEDRFARQLVALTLENIDGILLDLDPLSLVRLLACVIMDEFGRITIKASK